MNKLEMAHDFAMKLVGNPATPLKTMESIVDVSWKYADAMQAEADKREKEESEKKRADIREMLKANNTFVEREGQHFDDVEWKPDWSQAPDAKYWAIDSSGFADWFSDKPELDEQSFVGDRLRSALQYGYTGDWQDSLRKRPQ